MKIPVKVLYASYLPKVKDRDKILMADSGARVGSNPPMKNLLTSLPTGYLDNLESIGQGVSNGSPYPNRTPQPSNPFGQFDSRNPQEYNGPINPYSSSDTSQIQPDTSNYHPAGQVQGFPQGISNENYVNPVINPNKDYKPNPYKGQVGQGIVTAASVFDAFLPYGKINRWPKVTPGLSPNQHPYGTGSQALMEYGGEIETAKDGHWIQKAINPDHKGYCTPMTKATCTPHRKAFAMRAKHHNLKDGGTIGDGPVSYPADHLGSNLVKGKWVNNNFKNGGMVKMPGGGTTRGLLPTPTFQGSITAKDSSEYQRNFLNFSDPYAQRFYNTENQLGVRPASYERPLTPQETEDYQYRLQRHSAWDDAAGKNVMTDQQVHDELYRPFPQPKDIKVGYKKTLTDDLRYKKTVSPLKSGGSLSPSKAAEILHDGTAQGHPLTPKQRRFMGWKSHQKAPGGVTVPGTDQSAMQQSNPTGEQFTPHDRGDAYMVDALNETLITGKMAKNTGYTPDQQAIMKDAYMWRQVNGQRNNGQQNIEQYFNRPVNPNSPTDYYRGKLGHIGGGAVSMYNSTPSLDVQNAQSPNSVASMKQGGLIYDNGGPIQTHWGGNAEPIAYNPYDGGTTQFNGDSHAEGGIGMSFNGKKVEVEGGETAAKDNEGNLNIFGNMYVPGTRTKFKTASKEIAEKEEKFDKLKTNGTAVVNALEPKNKYDQIKFNAGELMMKGGDMGQKELAKKKQQLADLQNAMLDTAEMHNIDPQGMSQGNIKKAKKGMWMKAPDGAKVIKEGDEPVKDWKYYQRIIDATTSNVKTGNDTGQPLNDETYNDYKEIINTARSEQAKLGPGPRKQLDINEPTRSDRNNNPGNIKYGSFAKSIDPNVKRDKDGFAIFSDPTIGHTAMYSLLTGKGYKNLSVKDALTRWTGGKPYDLKGLGDLNGRKVSDLKPDELNNVLDYMQKGEGTAYGIPKTALPPLAGTPPAQPNVPGFGLPTAPPFTTAGPVTPVTQPSVPIRGIPNQPESRPRPTQAKPLGFGDVASDIFAIAQNQERPVYAQKYEPQLYQPYQVSFQDRLNDNNQSFNNVERLVGSTNPTALGALAAQKYGADNSVRGEEFRTNQAISNQVYNENIGLTNDAQWKNLGIADTQFTRQDLAGSKTREMNQLIANDISNKYSQVQMRNNTLRAYENLYNFRLQPNELGGLTETNYNDPQNFDFSGQNGRGEGAGPSQRKITNYDRNGNVKNYRTVQNSTLADENQQALLEERNRKNEEDMLKLFHGGNVKKRYKPIRL